MLKYLTRLLFLTLLTSCVVVMAASLLLLSQCRGRVRAVEEVVEASHGRCSPLPLPAYFACVVVVVTVFGFGCVGRKVTGLLLAAVSLVAMVVAVVVVVNQHCTEDDDGDESVQQALVEKLDKCGLYVADNSSSSGVELYPVQQLLHRYEFLTDTQLLATCRHTASSVHTLCRQYLPPDQSITQDDRDPGQSAGRREGVEGRSIPDEGVYGSMNQTGVEVCAREVSRFLHALCMRDTEISFPFLLTLPIFYTGVGVALIFIKHADLRAKATSPSTTTAATPRCSVGTNTERTRCLGCPETGGRRRTVSRWLSSVCVSHPLCLTCLLGGASRCSCRSSPSASPSPVPRPSSRLSFQLRQMRKGEVGEVEVGEGEGGEEEASLHMLRTCSALEPHEGLRLIEECV